MPESQSTSNLTPEEQSMLNKNDKAPRQRPAPQGFTPSARPPAPNPQTADLTTANTQTNAKSIVGQANGARGMVANKLDDMQFRREDAVEEDASRLAHLLSPTAYVDDVVARAGQKLETEAAKIDFFAEVDPFAVEGWKRPELKQIKPATLPTLEAARSTSP